jgi:hypothetical protein
VAVVAAVAVLVAAGTVTWLLGRGGSTQAGPPSVLPAGALTGDVDGDGTQDVVTLGRGDRLRVRLGSGRTVAQLLQGRPRLEGLADVGLQGLAVVASQTAEGRSRDWTAWVVGAGRLSPLHVRSHEVIGDEAGSSVAWVKGHRLYDGSLDPLQHGADRVAVATRSWTVIGGRLTPKNAGVWCWVRRSAMPPVACAAGQDWAYDVGSHGDLPRLLPTVHPAWADRSSTSFGGGTWKVRNLNPHVDPEAAAYDVVHDRHRVTHTARVPLGWAPVLFASPVRLGDGGSGLVLSQEGGDSDTWRVYVDRGGRVQPVAAQGPLPLGGGFTTSAGRQSVYYSWLTPEGHLFTRVGTGRAGRFHVYQWQPSGGDSASSPTLVARDLGIVCIDETFDTYGTCRS